MTTHSRILAWKIPWTEEPGGLQSMGSLRVGHDSVEKTLMLGNIEGRRRRGQQRMRWLNSITYSMEMSLSKLQEIVKDREATTERLHFHFSLSCIGEGNGNPLQCSYLENPRDRGAWWAAISGVAQSRTRLKRLSSSSSCKN